MAAAVLAESYGVERLRRKLAEWGGRMEENEMQGRRKTLRELIQQAQDEGQVELTLGWFDEVRQRIPTWHEGLEVGQMDEAEALDLVDACSIVEFLAAGSAVLHRPDQRSLPGERAAAGELLQQIRVLRTRLSLAEELARHSRMASWMPNSIATPETVLGVSNVARRLFDLRQLHPDFLEIGPVYLKVTRRLFELGGMTGWPFEVALPKWEAGQIVHGYPQDRASYERRHGEHGWEPDTL